MPEEYPGCRPCSLTNSFVIPWGPQTRWSGCDRPSWKWREAACTLPARAYTELGEGRLVFTAGALSGEWFGYRSYDTFDVDRGEQLVVVQSARTGRVRGIAVGKVLGQMRTGALGGVAADLLARPTASTIGVIGSGNQAWSQIWAITAVRHVERVSVYSRTTAHTKGLACECAMSSGLTVALSVPPRRRCENGTSSCWPRAAGAPSLNEGGSRRAHT